MHVLHHCHLLPGEGEGLGVTPLPGPVYGVAAVLLTGEITPGAGVVLIVRVGVLIVRAGVLILSKAAKPRQWFIPTGILVLTYFHLQKISYFPLQISHFHLQTVVYSKF